MLRRTEMPPRRRSLARSPHTGTVLDWGYSYLKAGFRHAGWTKGGLRVLQLLPGGLPRSARADDLSTGVDRMTQPNTPAPPPEERAPTVCPECGTGVEDIGGHLACPNRYCKRILVKTAAERTPPSAGATAGERGLSWSDARSILMQGASIQQDYMAGRYANYEDFAARVDAAAREIADGNRYAARAAAQCAECARLREALERYAEHAPTCFKIPRVIRGVEYGTELTPHPCTCGLDDVFAPSPGGKIV